MRTPAFPSDPARQSTDRPPAETPGDANDVPLPVAEIPVAEIPVAEIPVAEIMARLVSGDTAAVFTLAEHHGHRIAGVVRRQLRRCGVDAVSADEVRSLVLDSCIELSEVAPAWRPGGALPWWWAEGRIRSLVNGWVGVHADSIDDHWNEVDGRSCSAPAPSEEDSVAATFARLVEEVPLVGLVAEAAAAARVDEESLVCLLDYCIQQDQGDPSPAHTLAERYGVSPETLRQRICRGRRRLRRIVAEDPRFAALSDFELVA
jgi:hypothetical protein